MIALVLIVLGGILASAESCSAGQQLLRSGGLSDYQKQEILDAHNRIRQSVALGQVAGQPPAANMMEMRWDEELAATAQRWADQCITAHDRASQREVSRFPVGQNLAATWTTRPITSQRDAEPDFLKQINAWYAEVSIYTFRPINGGHGTGHYSQLVWGETSQVGCGFTFYYDSTRGYTKLYICNYGPGGNVIGSVPYVKGYPSCASYGLAESRKYTGLCSSSYTTSSNFLTLDSNTNNFLSNIIPESTGDSYNYQFTNGFDDQYSTPYQYQYKQTEDSTFKPLISILKGATTIFTKPKTHTISISTIYV